MICKVENAYIFTVCLHLKQRKIMPDVIPTRYYKAFCFLSLLLNNNDFGVGRSFRAFNHEVGLDTKIPRSGFQVPAKQDTE